MKWKQYHLQKEFIKLFKKKKNIFFMIDKIFNKNLLTSAVFYSGTGLIFYNLLSNNKKYEEINSLKLRELSEQNKVRKVELHNNRKALIFPKDEVDKIYHLNISDNNFVEKKIDKINKDIIVEHKNPSILSNIILASIPTFLIMGGVFYLFKKNTGKGLDFFKNEFKIVEEKLGVKIDDVAGLHQTKKDVLEFTDIIMNSDKYQEIGAKIPSGILMEGPPGTGKTLLAKAVADNYQSKFFLMNGSDFIQPIIGTGSRKVKKLFETARENSPSIIFIDEIDAIGKSRNVSKSIGNDERDNILNSLLVEMDGFNSNEKVLIMGATNRSDVLDPALLRPGRFDRVVNFELPNLEERKDILNHYFDKYKISEKIVRDKLVNNLAKLTYSFNGAQIQNLFNEASISAVRNDRKYIEDKDFDDSIDYVLLGNKKEGILTNEEKEVVSFHEAGHALMSYVLKNVPSPSKVSIIPRSKGALGFSQSIPEEEKRLYNDLEIKEQIMVLMGGRMAEEIIFGTVTNGASDDINRINNLANNYVGTFGMGENLKLRNIEMDTKNNLWRKESESMIENFDSEVNLLLDHCRNETKKIINENIIFLKKIQQELFTKETILFKDINDLYLTGS